MDWSNYKFRCSSLGKLMTNPPGKKDVDNWAGLSETTKTYLMECYVREKYGRDKNIINKYIEKGLAVEEDSITLYSRVTKTFFAKNEARIENEFISGTPDLFIGESILNAKTIIDIKSSWDVYTFFATMTKPVNKDYFYQLQGYCALSGAEDARLVYCLVDTPLSLIEDEKRRVSWKMGLIDPHSNEAYIQACEYLDKSMTFADIDIKERYIENLIPRDEDAILSVYKRVGMCREFLSRLSINP
jgi:hypothetical protein